MERVTEEQVAQLNRFVRARIADAASLQDEARPVVMALGIVAQRQWAAVHFHRTSSPAQRAKTELHAVASWNLLVSLAEVWRDHPDFPADAAIETFEFDSETPLSPVDTHPTDVPG
ncbi:hypothetical protein ACFY8C_12325 [Streptomyces flavochromogenes]|uniref:Uncharacterized protein n=1 Tax=Streptomyces flavochromogenes TaxID=68199 RepID=A0ABW6XNQ5_9ACTN|nr:hypothetical protein [Streptomyces flavochromogenes]